ncbi:hypothetical protein [uncultured Gammaproteobacteria bacterium]|nr:hypothetical protein [uncultured Gammaproteobacteria bacterium]
MKKLKTLFSLLAFILSFNTMALLGFSEDKKDTEANKEKTAEECEIPTFAKAIGHEDQWLLHNGCPPRKKIKEVVKSK